MGFSLFPLLDSNRKFNIHLIQIDYLFYFYNGTWIIKLNTFIAPLAYAIIALTHTHTYTQTYFQQRFRGIGSIPMDMLTERFSV